MQVQLNYMELYPKFSELDRLCPIELILISILTTPAFRLRLEHHGVVVIITHNLIQQSLNSGSVQVQILLVACERFPMMRISDNGPGWK